MTKLVDAARGRVVPKKGHKIGKKVKIKFVKDRPGHDFRYALNSKKIQRELGWKSQVNLIKGLNLTIEWYLNNPRFITSISKKLYVNRIGLKINKFLIYSYQIFF